MKNINDIHWFILFEKKRETFSCNISVVSLVWFEKKNVCIEISICIPLVFLSSAFVKVKWNEGVCDMCVGLHLHAYMAVYIGTTTGTGY